MSHVLYTKRRNMHFVKKKNVQFIKVFCNQSSRNIKIIIIKHIIKWPSISRFRATKNAKLVESFKIEFKMEGIWHKKKELGIVLNHKLST